MPNLPPFVVTRFAPSSAGSLHLGNARTALLNFLAARKFGGHFILRVEDTEQTRNDESYLRSLCADLRWLGLSWDQGPDVGGPHGTYQQADRNAIYEHWLAVLDAAGNIYPCFCTPTELNSSRRAQAAAGLAPRYAGTCRELTEPERAERLLEGRPASLRFRVPTGRVVRINDVVQGEQQLLSDDMGDFIIRRADGNTAFFCNAIDDALMGVTLVLRGEDHLPNTPRQILVLEALELAVPTYAHIPLLLGTDGAPLARRHGALTLQDLRKRGYLPEAIRNQLVRLGHGCPTEGWLDEPAMLAAFALERLEKKAARFDPERLQRWQREAVQRLPTERMSSWLGDHLPTSLGPARAMRFCEVLRPHLELPRDAKPWADALGSWQDRDAAALAVMRVAGPEFFAAAVRVLAPPAVDLAEGLAALAEHTHQSSERVRTAIQAALTGSLPGPDLTVLLGLLSRAEVIDRLERARRVCLT